MKFMEVFEKFLEGKPIKRQAKGFYIFIATSKKGLMSIRKSGNATNTSYILCVADLFAVDWEIIEE